MIKVIVKDIPFAEGYKASSLGEIISPSGKRRSLILNKRGYLSIILYGKNYLVHRIVAIVFFGEDSGRPFVNHKNGIKTDNTVSNLEWCTRSENNKHAYRIGLKKPVDGIGKWNTGKKNHLNKGRKVRHLGIVYNGVTEASISTGVPLQTIYSHCRGIVKKNTFEYIPKNK